MAIDLFCYSSTSVGGAQNALDVLACEHAELFADKFLISTAREASAFHKEIALEYGLDASCMFVVRVNDKNEVGSLTSVEALIKEKLGIGNVVILFENESLR